MNQVDQMNDNEKSKDFYSEAKGKRNGLVKEFYGFIKHNKKYWLVPIILVVVVLGALVVLGGSAAGPFIYTLF